MNRIDRLAAIVTMLQTKRIVRAEDIADRFEISKRTVYRDLRALEEAGIPLGAEAGLGYYIAEGYHLPPVMFTAKEAGALLTAEKLVEKFTDKSVDHQYKSAMDKIKSVLPAVQKDLLEVLNPNIRILQENNGAIMDFPNNFLTDIQHALATRKVLKIDYYAFHSETLTEGRYVEPIGLCYYGFSWHLIAYCRLRNDYRDFRLDRIKTLTLTDEKFKSYDKLPFTEYMQGLYRDLNMDPIVVRFNKSILTFVEKPKYYYGFVDEKEVGDQVEMYFMTDSLPYIARWIITHGDKAEVVNPVELKHEIVNLVNELGRHYL